MKDKKKFKDTKVGQWITQKAPHLLNTAASFLPENGAFGIIKNLVQNDEQLSSEDKFEFRVKAKEFELEFTKIFLTDKQNARELYKSDSWLQKIFALSFLVGYFALTGYIIYIVSQKIELQTYAVSLISTVWGAMSTKISEVMTFLFGSSLGSKQKSQELQRMISRN